MFTEKFIYRRALLIVGIVLATAIFSSNLIYSKQAGAEVLLYSETEDLMNKIAYAVRTNTFDYDSYSGCLENSACHLSEIGLTESLLLIGGEGLSRISYSNQSGTIVNEQMNVISSSELQIVDFTVYISPINKTIQRQPQATIVMKTTLRDRFLFGKTPELQRQRTISTGLIPDVQYYAK